MVSAGRINEVLDLYSTIESPEHPKEAKDIKGEVVFDNVSFRYDKILRLSLSMSALQPKQAKRWLSLFNWFWKSTLISLIPRFYDVTEGRILVDGVNVKDYQLEDLHNKIGYIPQKLFSFLVI